MPAVVTRRVRAGAPAEPLTEEERKALLEIAEPPKEPASWVERCSLDLALVGCIAWFAFVVYLLWW